MLEAKHDHICPHCGGDKFHFENGKVRREPAPLDCAVCEGRGTVTMTRALNYQWTRLQERIRSGRG